MNARELISTIVRISEEEGINLEDLDVTVELRNDNLEEYDFLGEKYINCNKILDVTKTVDDHGSPNGICLSNYYMEEE